MNRRHPIPAVRTRQALAALALLAGASAAQRVAASVEPPAPVPESCGSDVRPEELPLLLELEALGVYRLSEPQELVFNVPMTFHIVRRSNGTGGLSAGDADATLPVLNADFLPVGIRFQRAGSIDYINSDLFFSGINSQFLADQLRNVNPVANTINVYFVESFSIGGTSLCGQSTFTVSSPQGILMDNQCTTTSGNDSTFTHEVGHYFDLYHTHETAFGSECPDGSNCATAGDLVCDTPADPNVLNLVNGSCQYTGSAIRCFQTFNPPVENYMSYSPNGCQTTFTARQRERAGATLVNLRQNLIGSQAASIVWVDFAHTGFKLGSFSSPYASMSAALGAVAPGGRIVIKASSTSGAVTIDQNVRLDSFRGTATIGG